MEFEIRDCTPDMEALWEEQFVRYNYEDLGLTRIPEEVLREKIAKGILWHNLEQGISQIAMAFCDGKPAGFVMYQVDSEKSDWCMRPGWGMIREFCIVPELRHKGYGRLLAQYAEKKLGELSDRLYLTAHDEGAKSFWVACGFADSGEDASNGCRIFEKYLERAAKS